MNNIYLESVQRGLKLEDFIDVLGASVYSLAVTADAPHSEFPSAEYLVNTESQAAGCSLRYLVSKIKEHHVDRNKRHNKIPTRLIGRQATALAHYANHLVDMLQCPNEPPMQSLKRLPLCRIVYYLRNACAIFTKLLSTPAELLMNENYRLYVNLMCLFYPNHVNVITWTVAYSIPYHATKLYDMYKVVCGTISLQAKEAKHAAVKND